MADSDESGNGSDEESISNSDVTVGGRKIQAVSDTDEIESVLGWMTIYTIGPVFTLDRKWLEERAAELGIPDHMLPSEVTPKRAFTRASQRLVKDTDVKNELPADVTAETEREDYSTFNLSIKDKRGEGDWKIIGTLNYEDGDVYSQATTDNPEYIEWFQMYSKEFAELYELMGRSHMGKDIRKMVREFCKKHSTSVKMRDAGAVYFVPAHYETHLMAFKELVEDINTHWKDMGFDCSIDTVEVIDSPGKREMVEQKVQKQLSETVEGIVTDALDKFDEEHAANEVVSELGKELASVENLAVEHNTLLNAEMSVRSALEEWKDKVRSDEEEIVEELVKKASV